jgi:hypothetical protein
MNKIDYGLAENLGLTPEEVADLENGPPLSNSCLHLGAKAATEVPTPDSDPFRQPNLSLCDLVKAR